MENEFFIHNLTEFISFITLHNDDRINGYRQEISESNEVIRKFKQISEDGKFGNAMDYILPFFLQNSLILYDFLWYLEYEHFDASERIRFYYRGNSDKKYKLAPGIYRVNSKDENYFFREMQVRCAMQLSQDALLDKLVYLQHYECPTRLLDITTNPLVVLYFACGGTTKADGAVFCFNVREKDVLYPNSDRAQMLSHLCEFSKKEQQQIMVYAMLSYLSGKFKQKPPVGKYVEPIIERLYHAIKRETAAFEREMRPFDLLRPAFIQVAKSNPRIVKQDGAFIISGLSVDEIDCDWRINKYVSQRIIVPASSKAVILKELEQVGICEATLFPEADKVASYLKR